jgi:hypothetical protein
MSSRISKLRLSLASPPVRWKARGKRQAIENRTSGGFAGKPAVRSTESLPFLTALFTTGYSANGIVRVGRLDIEIPLLPKPFIVEPLARKVLAVIGDHHLRGDAA